MRQAVYDYIKKKYKVSPEYPWQKNVGTLTSSFELAQSREGLPRSKIGGRYDGNAVFRHKDNNKWFALVMDVQGDKVGVPETDYVDVINLKLDDMFFRDMIIQEDGIMPAYHMNKMHWVTVLRMARFRKNGCLT